MAAPRTFLFSLIVLTLLGIPLPCQADEPQILYPPGKSIPAARLRGVSQIGREHDYRSIVMGTADVFGHGPYDLFLHPNRLFPFVRFDERNVPVYGPSQITSGHAINGAVIAGKDNAILGVFAEGKRIRLCQFHRESLAFESLALSEELAIPEGMTIGLTGRLTEDGGLDIYFSVGDGVVYRPAGIYPKLSRIPVPFHHSPLYVPFDGAGFWRGGLPRRTFHHARFENLELKQVMALEQIGTKRGEFAFDQLGMGLATFSPGEAPQVVTSEHLGIFRRYQLDPKTGSLTPQGFVNNADDVALRHLAIASSLRPFPDPKTGQTNFLAGDIARVWFYRSSGRSSPSGAPILLPPEPVMAEKAPLRLGELPVISPGDLNGDGLIDFLVGNDAGELLFCQNIGEPGRPEFDNPLAVLAGDQPLNIKAGYKGSIQGPGEAMWGYTCPTACDWNGDGRLDVILNSVYGDYQVLLQTDSQDKIPAFTAPKWLYADGLQLHLAWRSQPGVTDWGLGKRLCLIALDEQNLLRQFWRIDDQNVERGELLSLPDGSPITANADETAGQTGRAKIVPHDWDGDGQIDLLIGTSRGLSFPAGKDVYYPSHHYPNHKASILFMRNIGTNEKPLFDYARLMQFKGEQIGLGIHSCSPAPVDFGNGSTDLFVSEENGTIRYYPKSQLSTDRLPGDFE